MGRAKTKQNNKNCLVTQDVGLEELKRNQDRFGSNNYDTIVTISSSYKQFLKQFINEEVDLIAKILVGLFDDYSARTGTL